MRCALSTEDRRSLYGTSASIVSTIYDDVSSMYRTSINDPRHMPGVLYEYEYGTVMDVLLIHAYITYMKNIIYEKHYINTL